VALSKSSNLALHPLTAAQFSAARAASKATWKKFLDSLRLWAIILEKRVQKSLKNGFAVASHHKEEEIPGGLPTTMSAHSASKSGPNSGSDKMETLSFQ
jgi:hypothetical protein